MTNDCRVYWGSHGCMLERGHDGEHLCTCTFENGVMLPHLDDEPEFGNVGRAPYYGPETRFYGEDADGPSDEPDAEYLVSFEIVTEQRHPKAKLSGITDAVWLPWVGQWRDDPPTGLPLGKLDVDDGES